MVSGVNYGGVKGAQQAGFIAGANYKLTLEDDALTFVGERPATRTYDFTIQKEEVMNVSLNEDIIYINTSKLSNLVVNGKPATEISVAVITIGQDGSTTQNGAQTVGSFTYTEKTLAVGDSVGIYAGDRIPDMDSSAAGDEMSFVTITAVDGQKFSYQGSAMEDVLFMPDVLPVPKDADTDGNTRDRSITVPVATTTYTDDKYANLGLTSQTTVDKGDFISFYGGTLEESGAGATATGYARIDKVETSGGNYIIQYTAVEQEEMMEAMSAYRKEQMEGEDLLEGVDTEEIERSVEQQARDSGFANEAGMYLAAMALETDSFTEISEDFDLSAYSVTMPEGMSRSGLVQMRGSKVEVDVTTLQATLSTKLIHFEDLSGLRLTLTVGVEVTIHAPAGDIKIEISGSFEQEVKIDLGVDGNAVWKWWFIFPYIAEYQVTAWVDLYTFTGIGIEATITTAEADDGEGMGTGDETFEDIGQQIKDLLDEKDKYLGLDFWYENGKRYLYTVEIFSGNVRNDTIDLVTEHYEFEFYVMGTMGMRAGVRASIAVGLFSTKLASVGFAAEAGVYVKVWGYFYYQLIFDAKANPQKTTYYAGALLFELGIYLEITFEAQAFNGTFSYNPTLLDKEWPLWSAGMRENVRSFAYGEEDAPELKMKKAIQTTIVPDALFEMAYLDLKTGDDDSKSFDDSTKYFSIAMTNNKFSYNRTTNRLTVSPGAEDFNLDGEMILTWVNQPLAFSSTAIQRRIPLHWDKLNDGYAIVFHTGSGSSIPLIIGRYGVAIQAPQDPVKKGYAFAGWDAVVASRIPFENLTYVAQWQAGADTPYRVEYYVEQPDGRFALQRLEEKTGVTGGGVDISALLDSDYLVTGGISYLNVTAGGEETTQPTITEDGKLIIKVNYVRDTHTATYQLDNGEPDAVDTYRYGARITKPENPVRTGYTFVGWDAEIPETMGTKDLQFTAQWTANENTAYKVEHYQQNANDDGYTLSKTENLTGITDTTATAEDQRYEYFTLTKPADGNIAGDGSLVLALYYDRDTFTVDYTVEGEAHAEAQTYKHGQKVVYPADPELEGYNFVGWALNGGTFEGVMPTESITLSAKWATPMCGLGTSRQTWGRTRSPTPPFGRQTAIL